MVYLNNTNCFDSSWMIHGSNQLIDHMYCTDTVMWLLKFWYAQNNKYEHQVST